MVVVPLLFLHNYPKKVFLLNLLNPELLLLVEVVDPNGFTQLVVMLVVFLVANHFQQNQLSLQNNLHKHEQDII